MERLDWSMEGGQDKKQAGTKGESRANFANGGWGQGGSAFGVWKKEGGEGPKLNSIM